MLGVLLHFFFFFQAEDGIRDLYVTGVQTCALPISFGYASAGIWLGQRLSRSISQRPAGPGGAEVGKTADIGMIRPPDARSSIESSTSLPSLMSRSTACSGIPPQPRPFSRKACLAKRSANRHVWGDMTPNSRPSDKDDLSVSTSCTCLISSDFSIVSLIDASGWSRAATITNAIAVNRSPVSDGGMIGSDPTTPRLVTRSRTGW